MTASPHHPPRFLFIPVSGPFGTGEYFRSVAIAREVRRRWPGAEIRFLVSREAPYAANVPFDVTLLPSSPTFSTPQVTQAIEAFRPDIAIFDNAGRLAQLQAARRAGASIVYINERSGSRGRRAARPGWLRLLDEHWIAFPRLIVGEFGPFERLMRRFAGSPAPRWLDVVLPPRDELRGAALLAELGIPAPPVLVVPGGGTSHPGAMDAPARFRAVAVNLAASGVPTIYVGPAMDQHGPGDDPPPAMLCSFNFLPQPRLIELIRCARLVVSNGGTTLLHTLACGTPCVAAPVAGDQPPRVRRAAAARVIVASTLDTQAMTSVARRLLDDEPARMDLARRAAALCFADGLPVAIEALAGLLAKRQQAPAHPGT